MEKRVTRHSSAHATAASHDAAAPNATPIVNVNTQNSKQGRGRGRGRGRGKRGDSGGEQTVASARRESDSTRGRKCGIDTSEMSSALEEAKHDTDHYHDVHDESDSDHVNESEQQITHESEAPPSEDKVELVETRASDNALESFSNSNNENQDHGEDESQEESSSSSDSEGEVSGDDKESPAKNMKNSDAMDIDPQGHSSITIIPNLNDAKKHAHSTHINTVEKVSNVSTQHNLKEMEPVSLKSSNQNDIAPTTTLTPAPLTDSSKDNFFLDEDTYNRISIGGSQRMTDLYMFKKRQREKNAYPEPGLQSPSEIAVSTSNKSKRRISGSSIVLNSSTSSTSHPPATSTGPSMAPVTVVSDEKTQPPSSITSVTPTSSNNINLNDLLASVSSYKPEMTSAVDMANNTQQQPAQQQPAQQQQHTIAAIKPADVRYHHPCISAHQYRSVLTREEHRRYLMYDGILRRQKIPGAPQLGSEDRALFNVLQEKVEGERHRVRQWCDAECRSRVISYFNPLIRDALAPKFKRGRTRIMEEYPRYYEFLYSIGLRLPGVPSTTKEPMLSRASLVDTKPGSVGTSENKPTTGLQHRGLLKRTGRICPVSLAKPILPTDENGVPYEKPIDVNDSYWNHSASPASKTDHRRGPMPFKRAAVSVAKDPTIKEFVKEHNVHIALASSTMVALAKTLPSLANEWEIPITVVLEEDSNGTMQKRIYVDKPLIPKRMTTLEITQMFYDGVLKKLSLVGSSSSDVAILEPGKDIADAGSSAPTTQLQPTLEDSSIAIEDKDIEMQSVDNEQENIKSPKDIEMERSKSKDTEKSKSKDTEDDMQSLSKDKDMTTISKDEDKNEEEAEDEGILGSQSAGKIVENGEADNFEYSLWTFGDIRLLIRNRLHGYLNNTIPHRQVVIKSILDYAPDIGVSEPGKSTMAGWWMATWVRDDRLLALGRVDVSKNQFVRYPEQLPPTYSTENPLGGAFSDLPSISIKDTSALKAQDREIGDWIKPNMRLIHYILGKLQNLGPGQYILAHKRHDVSADVYRAVQTTLDVQTLGAKDQSHSSQSSASHRGQYDLYAAHVSSPQPLSDTKVEVTGNHSSGGSSGGGGSDEDLLLRWIGTPDQIPGTFPYEPEADTFNKKGKRARGGGGGGGRGNKRKKGKNTKAKALE
ncbi:hypothetical protein FBU30_007999 [Linnemannia zychae]|nr:hypothetical protein FBU30_007999 [Linnemannia zychae]